MTDEKHLTVREDSGLLSVIEQIVATGITPDSVAAVGKLLEMQERVIADQRKQAFFAALGRLTDKMPEIIKHGQSHHGKYARLEDIDRAIRPLLAGEGFSMSFDSQAIDGKVRVICRLAHAEGHSETKQIDLPLDNSGSKNGAQAVISTVSYGRRALTKMFFNLVESGEDTDGNDPTKISPEQVKDIETALSDTKSDRAKFLSLIAGVEHVEDIEARDFKRVMNALNEKRRSVEGQR